MKRLEENQLKFTAGVVTAFVVFALCTMGFVALARDVNEHETMAYDTALLRFVHSGETHFLDTFVPLATDIGGVIGASLLTLLILGLFVYKREYVRALGLFMCVAGAAILNLILKSVFERARPDLWERLVNEASYSFPSGHAMASAAIGIGLTVALWNSRWRWWAFAASTAYVLFVGYTRLYLGVHYPTDILAGWLVSGAWVMAVALMIRSRLGHKALKNLVK
ncbi:phosphatase PAP2 family protein [Candidatus Saccharibacteria bacterium]|nr:MAG: phosphatase PAP2 family protein [Candidatus Saccharibacteria bacterium]